MPIDAEMVMLSRAHRDDSNRLPGQRFGRQMIEKVFQRARKRSAINRTREDHAVGAAHALDYRGGVIVVLLGRPAVGECDLLVSEVNQFNLDISPGCARSLQEPLCRVEQASWRRDASENR